MGLIDASAAIFCIPGVGLNEEKPRPVLLNCNLQLPQSLLMAGSSRDRDMRAALGKINGRRRAYAARTPGNQTSLSFQVHQRVILRWAVGSLGACEDRQEAFLPKHFLASDQARCDISQRA